MANRIRIQKQTELSASAGSIIVTTPANEQSYVAAGANDTVLTVVGGVPTWQAPAGQSFTLSDGTTTQVINNGDTLLVSQGDGITASISATDTLNILARLSTDANNSLSFGSDGGLYFNEADNLTSAAWNDTTNSLDLTFDVNGTATVVSVPIVDNVANFLSDFTITGDTGTDLVNNHETVNFEGGDAVTTTVTGNNVKIDFSLEKESFGTLTTGSTVTLANTPVQIISITRNGIEQDVTDDYTIAGSTVTFVEAFGVSSGAAGSEKVIATYTI